MPPPMLVAIAAFLLFSGCDLSNSVAQRPHGPSRVPIGEIVTSAWLPAGIEEFRFTPQDQQLLADIGLTQVQWLQRAEQDGQSAEALLMDFASAQGMGLPVYFEPPGYSPYDKLRNWATMVSVNDTFDTAIQARIAALTEHWAPAPAFAGYLIGHEDYRAASYDALARTVAILRGIDAQRPVYVVGAIGSYPQVDRFLDALFIEGGPANLFQHEHYVFEADVAVGSDEVLRRLSHLVRGYDRVARHLRDRYGRWHAILQAHAESRDGTPFYRQPTAAEIGVQAGLALSRGASGIVYFLYSSGLEHVRNGTGEVVQIRDYVGLVDNDGVPTAAWSAAQDLNQRLRGFGEALADRFFRGGYEARHAPADEPVASTEADLDLAFYGDSSESGGTSHVLIVNRRTDGNREVRLEVADGIDLVDTQTGRALATDTGAVALVAGGFRLFEVIRPPAE
jgi:hypothetical protein